MRLAQRLTLGAALCVLLAGPVLARPPAVTGSEPSAHAIIREPHASYVIRFDAPVNHRDSKIEILQGTRIIETLRPLADSAVDVLFAGAPAPPPGQYTLRWTAVSATGETSTGDIPFTVDR